jgi:hypothetical protein
MSEHLSSNEKVDQEGLRLFAEWLGMNYGKKVFGDHMEHHALRIFSHATSVIRSRASAHEPPAKPVAWRGVLDSAYELHPRYVYSDSQPERGKWEPLYAAPAASAQPPPVGWVSVDDRLPELEAKVLYAFNGYTWLGRYKGLNDGLPCFAGPAGFISGDATHWMLCPEPPASPPTKSETCPHGYKLENIRDGTDTCAGCTAGETSAVRGCIHGSDPVTECEVCYPKPHECRDWSLTGEGSCSYCGEAL